MGNDLSSAKTLVEGIKAGNTMYKATVLRCKNCGHFVVNGSTQPCSCGFERRQSSGFICIDGCSQYAPPCQVQSSAVIADVPAPAPCAPIPHLHAQQMRTVDVLSAIFPSFDRCKISDVLSTHGMRIEDACSQLLLHSSANNLNGISPKMNIADTDFNLSYSRNNTPPSSRPRDLTLSPQAEESTNELEQAARHVFPGEDSDENRSSRSPTLILFSDCNNMNGLSEPGQNDQGDQATSSLCTSIQSSQILNAGGPPAISSPILKPGADLVPHTAIEQQVDPLVSNTKKRVFFQEEISIDEMGERYHERKSPRRSRKMAKRRHALRLQMLRCFAGSGIHTCSFEEARVENLIANGKMQSPTLDKIAARDCLNRPEATPANTPANAVATEIELGAELEANCTEELFDAETFLEEIGLFSDRK